ncbi:MAG: serine protease [Bacteroidota bacterium]
MILLSFPTWWEALTGTEQIYWGIAIVSTAIFMIQLVLTFVGIDGDVEAEIGDADGGFSVFSIRGVIAFVTFFGWGGVAALSQGFSAPKAFMVGFLAGFLAMVGIAYAFAQMLKLQESGTVEVYDAIKKTADVYLTIPDTTQGKGKIHIVLNDKLMEFDAISDADRIPTGAKVRVVDVLNDNVMLVRAI